MSRTAETVSFRNVSATPANFTLYGGAAYLVQVVAATYGSVQLNVIGPDGTTLLPVGALIVANGSQTLSLPGGTYQLTIAGATGVYASIARVNKD